MIKCFKCRDTERIWNGCGSYRLPQDIQRVARRRLRNIHPGEVLLEEFLIPMKISQNKLGREIGVSPRRINQIVHGKRSITADTALRLSRYFGTSAAFWLSLQNNYDLEEEKRRLGNRLEREVHIHSHQCERIA